MKNFVLNIAQHHALRAISQKRKEGVNRGVVVLPTGTGKTYVSAIDAKIYGKKVLYLAHQEQILRQAKKSFEKLTDFETSFYIGKEKNISDATFSTIQTMTRNCLSFPKKLFDYIILDECHHSQTKSYRKVINHFQPKYLLGLTATPYRNDKQNIYKICGKPYFSMKIREAIEHNILAKINYYYVDNDIDFSKILIKHSGYDEKDLNKKLLVPKYDKAILKEYQKSAIGKRTIVFCASIEHAERLKNLFDKKGYFSAIAHSGMKIEDVQKNIGKFFTGKLSTIFVRDLFNEGIDVPSCDCIMLLRPTESKIIFEQQLGRGLRLTRRKKEVLVLDFTANSLNNKLNLDFLDSFAGGKLLTKIYGETNRHREEKEIVVYDEMVNVRLSKRKMDILYNFSGNIESRKKKMVENYLELKKKLGRIPTAHDVRKERMGVHFGYDSYLIVFGSWQKFKESMKDEQLNLSKEKMINQLKNFKEKHGHFPTVRELRKNKMISDNTFRRAFGSFENAVLRAGGSKHDVKKFMNLDKKKFLENFYECKKKLGKVPFEVELEEFNGYNTRNFLRKFFGTLSYTVFLKKIGETPQKRPDWMYRSKKLRSAETEKKYYATAKYIKMVKFRPKRRRGSKLYDYF